MYLFSSPLVGLSVVTTHFNLNPVIYCPLCSLHCVDQKLMATFDAPPDDSRNRARAACIYSRASLWSSTEVLPPEANMGTQATKSYDISDLCTGTVNTASWGEDRDAGWSIETAFASTVFPPLSRIPILIKNLLPAIRVGLLMVSWVDRGLDLEKEGEGEGERGDNGIEIVRNWLMQEIQKDGGA